jgi:hypothetical protein
VGHPGGATAPDLQVHRSCNSVVAAEIACRDTWRNLAAELDRIQLHTYDTGQGTVSQRTRVTAKQSSILERLGLSEPPRYYDFVPLDD